MILSPTGPVAPLPISACMGLAVNMGLAVKAISGAKAARPDALHTPHGARW